MFEIEISSKPSRDATTGGCPEPMSKRRRGFPSETNVKRGVRGVVTELGFKDFHEKLGRNDPCPCGSWERFQELLHA